MCSYRRTGSEESEIDRQGVSVYTQNYSHLQIPLLAMKYSSTETIHGCSFGGENRTSNCCHIHCIRQFWLAWKTSQSA